jgi:hypothetical protein
VIKQIALGALCTLASMGANALDAVFFEVTLTKAGQVIASPQVIADFGRRVSVDVSKTTKFEAIAKAPDSDGVSYTKAKIFVLEGSNVTATHEFTIAAEILKLTSVEYEVPGTGAKVRVVQRFVRL